MAIEIADLTQLSIDQTREIRNRSQSRLQAYYPTYDFVGGPAYYLLLQPHAQLEAVLRESLDRYLSARSLLDIENDPTLADPEEVDRVLSNWGVSRQAASSASGEIAIVRNSNASLIVPRGAVFQANGTTFVTTVAFSAKAEEELISDESTDRLITQVADNRYVFTIFVTAGEEGAIGKLRKGDTLVPNVPPADFISSYAVSDFTDGRDVETNQQMLTRLRAGSAIRALSNRMTMDATLRNEFPDILRHSIVGYGDPEAVRSDRSLFPIKVGGRIDWYIRPQADLQLVGLTVTGTVQSIEDDGAAVRIQLPAEDAAGVYKVRTVRREGADANTAFNITAQAHVVELPSTGFVPDVETAAEAAYSAYAGMSIDILDDTTGYSSFTVGQEISYELETVGLPLIADIQDYVNRRDVRMGDTLIRAVVPCFVKLQAVLDLQEGSATPDTDAIALQLQQAVHAVEFTGSLYRSRLLDAAHDLLTDGTSVGAFQMYGVILNPDGTETLLTGSDVLRVTDNYEKMSTQKTVQFFCELADISVETRTVIPAIT